MAKRVVLVQAVLISSVVTALLLRELPGLVREIRMWRTAASPPPRR